MFIFILTYKKPLEEVEKHLQAHKDYLDEKYDAGCFLASGRRVPRTGGVILCSAKDKEQAQKLMQEDPFYIEGVASYELIEVEFSKHIPGLEAFI